MLKEVPAIASDIFSLIIDLNGMNHGMICQSDRILGHRHRFLFDYMSTTGFSASVIGSESIVVEELRTISTFLFLIEVLEGTDRYGGYGKDGLDFVLMSVFFNY